MPVWKSVFASDANIDCSTPGGSSIDCGVRRSDTPVNAAASGKRTLFIAGLLCATAISLRWGFSASVRGTDFPDFYCAARMLAAGQGHQLYDVVAQYECQARFTGGVGTLYIHPPFEAPLYLAVAWLPIRRAFFAWFLLSLIFLAIAIHRLTKDALGPWDWRITLAASLTFTPVLLCCAQGQDSSLLLLLVVLAFGALRRGLPFAAGIWLALGLFKFQIVLPILLVLLVAQGKPARKALLKGFSMVALILAVISAAICGPTVFLAYPRFLLHLRQQTIPGIVPQAMPNLRGFTWIFLRDGHSALAGAVVVVLSVAVLIRAISLANRSKPSPRTRPETEQQELDQAFAFAVLFAMLVSYHLNPHDLTLALLPIFLLLHRKPRPSVRSALAKWITWASLGMLLLPIFQLLALREHVYGIYAVPLILLLFFGFPSTGETSEQADQLPCGSSG